MEIIKERKKDIFMLVLFILFAYIGIDFFIIQGISNLFGHDYTNSSILSDIFSPIIPLLIGCYLFRKELMRSFYFFKDKTIYKILGVFGFVAVDIAISNLSAMFFMNPKSTNNETGAMEAATTVPFMWTILVTAIAAPILEEIIFRHILIGRLSKYVNVYVAATFSVLLFSIAHISQLNEIFVYLPGAVILTIAYLASKKSIIYPIIIHVIMNFLSCLGDLLS